MKNGKWLGIVVFFVMVIGLASALAGCVEDTRETIEGTIHNTIEDEKCWIYVHYKASGALYDSEAVKQNSTEIYELPVGSFIIKAYDSHDNFIASTDLVIDATDTSFTIVVYSDDIHATSS